MCGWCGEVREREHRRVRRCPMQLSSCVSDRRGGAHWRLRRTGQWRMEAGRRTGLLLGERGRGRPGRAPKRWWRSIVEVEIQVWLPWRAREGRRDRTYRGIRARRCWQRACLHLRECGLCGWGRDGVRACRRSRKGRKRRWPAARLWQLRRTLRGWLGHRPRCGWTRHGL